MNPNRKTVKCELCGSDAELLVVSDGFDDAPTSFTITRTCSGPCEKRVLADDGAGDARENWAPAYGVVLIVFDRVFSSQTETVTVPPMEVANIRPRRWFQYSVFSF